MQPFKPFDSHRQLGEEDRLPAGGRPTFRIADVPLEDLVVDPRTGKAPCEQRGYRPRRQPSRRKAPPTNRGRRIAQGQLTEDTLRQLLTPPPDRRYPCPWRDRAIAGCLAYTGRPLRHLLRLEVDDLPELRAQLPAHAQTALDGWMQRRRWWACRWLTDLVFCSLRGAPLKPHHVRAALYRLGARVGISRLGVLVLRRSGDIRTPSSRPACTA